MHEMSLCQNILEILEDQAVQQSFSRVDRVHLSVGTMSGVELEALRFGFDVVMKGSLAEDAKLEITCPQAMAWCMACGKSVPVSARYDPCPECGSHQLQITDGDTLKIKELEVS